MNKTLFKLSIPFLILTTSCEGKAVNKEALVESFIYHESRGNDRAINPRSKATGCLQLMPIMIREANRIVGVERYRLNDRLSRKKSIEIFHVIMGHKNPTYNIEKACQIWNPRGGKLYLSKIRGKYNEFSR